MGDQGRWFKLWVSVLMDDHLMALPPATRWAWAALGCYLKLHGTNGRVSLNGHNSALAGAMGVTVADMISVIHTLPHVRLEKDKTRHGAVIVTMENWHKYQEDTTMAERQRVSRSKRRGEEKRGEEKRGEEKKKTSPADPPSPLDQESWGTPAAFVAKFNAETPDDTPAVESLTDGRRKKIREALKQRPDEAFWTAIFQQFHESKWLRGLVTRGDWPKVARDLDWLLQRGKDGVENFVKVAERKYADEH